MYAHFCTHLLCGGISAFLEEPAEALRNAADPLPREWYDTVVTAAPGYVKVRFRLEQDADGWPPVASEGLWAEPVGIDDYRIDNTPWFVRGVSADDVVRAVADDDGMLWATSVVRQSGRLTVRVIPFRAGPLKGDRQAVLDAFKAVGVSGEGIEQYGIVALDIPPEADLGAVKQILRQGVADGSWEFEEGNVSEAWITL